MKNSDPQPDRRRFSGLLRATRLLLFVAASAAAAEPPAPAPTVTVAPPVPPAVPAIPPVPLVVPPPAGLTVTVPAETTPPPRVITKEQKIYVPFEKLEQASRARSRASFCRTASSSTCGIGSTCRRRSPRRSRRCRACWRPRITRARSGDVATLQGKLAFEALKKGWSRLKLGAPGLALSEAKSTATLSAAEDGYEILFPEKGAYTLDATILGKITREAGRSTLELPLPKTAVSQFDLTIPEKGLEFTITPAAAYSATETPGGGTKLLVYFGAADKVSVAWTHRVGETALKPLLFRKRKPPCASAPARCGRRRTSLTAFCAPASMRWK